MFKSWISWSICINLKSLSFTAPPPSPRAIHLCTSYQTLWLIHIATNSYISAIFLMFYIKNELLLDTFLSYFTLVFDNKYPEQHNCISRFDAMKLSHKNWFSNNVLLFLLVKQCFFLLFTVPVFPFTLTFKPKNSHIEKGIERNYDLFISVPISDNVKIYMQIYS